MPLGTIAVYNNADGVGVIADEDGERRPFSGMETQTTREGQRVLFDVVGEKATNVIAVR